MSLHHHFSKNKKVYITLKDGTRVVDKYKDSSSQYFITENNKFKWEDIRSTNINRLGN